MPADQPKQAEITEILQQLGSENASNDLLPLVYKELRKLARSKINQENGGQTLQATDLVHEAYLRLVRTKVSSWDSRGHFFAAAAEAMRRILIERARQKTTVIRGGEYQRLELSDHLLVDGYSTERLLALDEALTKLEQEDQKSAEIVKLKAFAGLAMEDIAQALNLSLATAYRRWTYARAFLISEVDS